MQLLLACILSVITLVAAEQVVLSDELGNVADNVELERDAPFIFNNVNSLLRQWGNTLAPNGFSFIVASIPAGTTLYHARKDEHDPPSPEWLAFDSEMSYAIMGGRGGETFLRTYRSVRTLGPLLYINGMSAALTTTGSLDSQDLLVGAGRGIFDEYGRATRLCEWGAPLGVQGFVRQNAGFELLWCDWATGIELVHNNNVTHWLADLNATIPDGRGSPRGSNFDGVFDLEADENLMDVLALRGNESTALLNEPYLPQGPGPGPTRPPYRRYGWSLSPFAMYSFWEWLRSATLVYGGVGEMRVQLVYGSFVTCYGRAGLSLPSRDPTTHRLTNMTLAEDTARTIREDVAASVASYNAGKRSTADWRGITDQVVNRYGRRLPELHALLLNGTADALRQGKYLIASLLIPSYNPAQSHDQNRAACARAFVPPVEALATPAERVVLDAVTVVQRDICGVLLALHDDLFNGHTGVGASHAARLRQLMERLGWYLWTKCDDECAWGQVCYIPIWPVLMGRPGRRDPGSPSEPTKPICLGYGESP